MYTKEETITCSNCGAGFHRKEAQCPYCGYINKTGVEQVYQDKMEQIREDLDELDDVSRGIYRKEWKTSFKRLRKVIIITSVIVLLLVAILWGFESLMYSTNDEADMKDRLRWKTENEERLDQWYEEEDYEAILNFFYGLSEEEQEYFYSWEHSYFLYEYENYAICMLVRDQLRSGKVPEEDAVSEAVACCMNLLFFYQQELYSEDEQLRMEGFQKEVEKFLYGELQFTQQEAQELAKKANNDGYLSYEVCYDYVESIMDRYQ